VADWLTDFVEYASHGEASSRLMYWVGVSTVAGALRRKVWIDMGDFQWSPNFYILIVGEPGMVRKSTSIDVGMRFLKRIDGVHRGPAIVTWQALIQDIANCRDDDLMPDGSDFESSPVHTGDQRVRSVLRPAEPRTRGHADRSLGQQARHHPEAYQDQRQRQHGKSMD
jgi:hypothetical protein